MHQLGRASFSAARYRSTSCDIKLMIPPSPACLNLSTTSRAAYLRSADVFGQSSTPEDGIEAQNTIISENPGIRISTHALAPKAVRLGWASKPLPCHIFQPQRTIRDE